MFSVNAIHPRLELEEYMENMSARLGECCKDMTDEHIKDHLQQLVLSGEKQHNEVCAGMLYQILTEGQKSALAMDQLMVLNQDSFQSILSILNKIVIDYLGRINDVPYQQMFSFIDRLMMYKIQGVETLILSLLKQINGGNLSPGNLRLSESVLNLLKHNWAWLENKPFVLASSLFRFLRLIEDHENNNLTNLRNLEIGFCIKILREKFDDCIQLGRDLVRLLQSVSRYSPISEFWADILHHPTKLSPKFQGIGQLLSKKTPRRFLAILLTHEMEKKINFLTLKVPFSKAKTYEEWIYHQYFTLPESHSHIPDIIRYLCCVIHPSNEELSSALIPRWAIMFYFLFIAQQRETTSCVTKLTIFYDWLFCVSEKENIMNLEPGILLIVNSAKTHPEIALSLIDFLCQITSGYFPMFSEHIKASVTNSFTMVLQKGVIPSMGAIEKLISTQKKLFEDFTNTFPTLFKPVEVIQEISSGFGDVAFQNQMDVIELEEISSIQRMEEPECHEVIGESSVSSEIVPEELVFPKLIGMEELSDFKAIQVPQLRDSLLNILENRPNEIRIEASRTIIQSLLNMSMEISLLKKIAICLAHCSINDLATSLSSQSNLSLNSSQFLLPFQFILLNLKKDLANKDKSGMQLNPSVAHTVRYWQEIDCRVGYQLLHCLSQPTGGSATPSPPSVRNQSDGNDLALYQSYHQSLNSNFAIALITDMKICSLVDRDGFLVLAPNLFRAFPHVLKGNCIAIHRYIHCISPVEICDVLSMLATQRLDIFDPSTIKDLILASFEWNSFEQICFWKMLDTQNIPFEVFPQILNSVNMRKNPDAYEAIRCYFASRPPNAMFVEFLIIGCNSNFNKECSDENNQTLGKDYVCSVILTWLRNCGLEQLADSILTFLSSNNRPEVIQFLCDCLSMAKNITRNHEIDMIIQKLCVKI